MSGQWSVTLIAVALALSGCTKSNPDYCDVDTPCVDPARPICMMADGEQHGSCEAATCTRSDECTATAPVCDGVCRGCAGDGECVALDPEAPLCSEGQCVQCVAESDCSDPAMPVCSAGQCSACSAHDECSSQVCNVTDGTCLAADDVIYVATDGSDVLDCGTSDAPCQTVTRGLTLVTDLRPVIRVAPGTYEEDVQINVSVRIVGPGAVIRSPFGDADAVVTIRNDVEVELDGLSMTHGQAGILCAPFSGLAMLTVTNAEVFDNGKGIWATACSLTLSRSIVQDNAQLGIIVQDQGAGAISDTRVVRNGSGGVSVGAAPFTMTNCVVASNGDQDFGGLSIRAGATGHVTFTTISNNSRTDATGASAVQCDAGADFVLSNNIVFGNSQVGGTVGGDCTWRYSLVEGGVDGEGNLVADPKWVDADGGDYHLAADSPAIDAADPDAELDHDIDGDSRPQGDGWDLGADEVVTP